MGGLFSTKRCSVADWTRVRQNMQWELSNNQILEPIKTILLLSYYDLPYRLKCCFLYCCMFPEDDIRYGVVGLLDYGWLRDLCK
ncbi:Disease resistance protein RPM1 [Linum perenne]